MKVYLEHVQITAHRAEQEPERLIRLQRVLGYVFALAEHYGNDALLEKLDGLNDHKGHLSVIWRRPPTSGEKDFFRAAWMSLIGDGSDHVEHQSNDESAAEPPNE